MTFSVGFLAPGSSEVFGIGAGESDTCLPTNLMFITTTGDTVDGLPQACASPNSILVEFYTPNFDFGCDVLDFQALTGAIVMRFAIDDATKTVLPAYSIDGRTMFEELGGWDAPTSAGWIWAYSDHAYASVFATYDVPAPSYTPGSAAALLALAVLARRRGR